MPKKKTPKKQKEIKSLSGGDGGPGDWSRLLAHKPEPKPKPKLGSPEGPKSDPTDPTTGARARANLRRLSGKSLEAQRESLRRRPTSIKGSRRRQSADEAQREIDKGLGDAQHRYQLHKQERDKKVLGRAGKAAGKGRTWRVKRGK